MGSPISPRANQSNLFFLFDHLKFSIIDARGVSSLVKFRIHFLPLSWAKSYWSGSWNILCGSTRVEMLYWGTSCRAPFFCFLQFLFFDMQVRQTIFGCLSCFGTWQRRKASLSWSWFLLIYLFIWGFDPGSCLLLS